MRKGRRRDEPQHIETGPTREERDEMDDEDDRLRPVRTELPSGVAPAGLERGEGEAADAVEAHEHHEDGQGAAGTPRITIII